MEVAWAWMQGLRQIWLQMVGRPRDQHPMQVGGAEGADGLEGEAEGAGEGADGLEGFRWINIQGKLCERSLEGLDAVLKARQASACLAAPLANVQHTLRAWTRSSMRLQHPGDVLEMRSARGLLEIDELLQDAPRLRRLPVAAVDALKVLQKKMHDVALLACSRFIAQTELWAKGIGVELLCRLRAAFGEALDDDYLWSRLGNSKYHLFTEGQHFGLRKHRHGRGGRKSRRSADEDATAGGGRGRGVGAAMGAAEPMYIHLPDSDASAMGAAEPMYIHLPDSDASAMGAAEPMYIHLLPDGDAHVEISPCDCALGEPMWIHVISP